MNKFIRYWNQNRKKIIIIIAVIAFIIILIQIINSILANGAKTEINSERKDKTKPSQSVITGGEVPERITDNNTETIKQFVNYCNNKEYEKAYNLLSDDCKAEYNNNINLFINSYYKTVFTNQKTYNLELWLNENNTYTYKITYVENNLLATGGTNINNNIEDYITIIKQNNENKININGFIKKVDINRTQTANNIEIIINSKKVYKSYETYNITIKNSTSKNILVSERKDNSDICLVDKNDVEYQSFLDEITTENLSVKPGQEKNITIRFNKLYDLYRTIEKMQFKNIITDTESPNKEKISIAVNV